MRTIDAMAASLAVIAVMAISQGVQPSPDELAADSWILEQDVIGLLGAMSRPASACYATALAESGSGDKLAEMAEQRAGLILAASCDPSVVSDLA